MPYNILLQKNALLITQSLSRKLYINFEQVAIEKAAVAKSTAKKASIAVASASVGTSFINLNPSTLFNVINTIECFAMLLCTKLKSSLNLVDFTVV